MADEIKEGDSLELELEGKIFMVHKDINGVVISREELDGELALKALLTVLSDALENYFPPELLDQAVDQITKE